MGLAKDVGMDLVAKWNWVKQFCKQLKGKFLTKGSNYLKEMNVSSG